MNHGLEEQKRVNPLLINLAKKMDIKCVATNDVHYLNKDDALAHEVQMCIQMNKLLNDPNRMGNLPAEFYLKSKEEMLKAFPDIPEAVYMTYEIVDTELTKYGYRLVQGYNKAKTYLTASSTPATTGKPTKGTEIFYYVADANAGNDTDTVYKIGAPYTDTSVSITTHAEIMTSGS